jgi:hypothetical protein
LISWLRLLGNVKILTLSMEPLVSVSYFSIFSPLHIFFLLCYMYLFECIQFTLILYNNMQILKSNASVRDQLPIFDKLKSKP